MVDIGTGGLLGGITILRKGQDAMITAIERIGPLPSAEIGLKNARKAKRPENEGRSGKLRR